jgi:hypothetical protein
MLITTEADCCALVQFSVCSYVLDHFLHSLENFHKKLKRGGAEKEINNNILHILGKMIFKKSTSRDIKHWHIYVLFLS